MSERRGRRVDAWLQAWPLIQVHDQTPAARDSPDACTAPTHLPHTAGATWALGIPSTKVFRST